MKREQEGDDSVGSVKRLASSTLVPSQIFVHPQHFTSVPLLPPAGAGSLVGAPTAVAINVQTQHSSIGGDQCLLGGTITYTQPNLHSSPCNIVLASPQPYVTSVPVSHISSSCSNSAESLNPVTSVSHIANSSCNSAENLNVISSSPHGSSIVTNYSLLTSESNHLTYPNATAVNCTVSYPDTICNDKRDVPLVDNIDLTRKGNSAPYPSEGCKESISCTHQHKRPEALKQFETVATKKGQRSRLSSFLSKRLQESKNTSAYAVRRSQESPEERQERLSQKFNALIRGKILELVRARGAKKTVCPSEVARGLSPKAWRDLMPNVRKIGGELVEEGLILVTQRGIIVNLKTVRGPVRFGLAQED